MRRHAKVITRPSRYNHIGSCLCSCHCLMTIVSLPVSMLEHQYSPIYIWSLLRLIATCRCCPCYGRAVHNILFPGSDLDWWKIHNIWTDGWHDHCMVLINIVGLSHSALEAELLLEVYLCMIMSLRMETNPSALLGRKLQSATQYQEQISIQCGPSKPVCSIIWAHHCQCIDMVMDSP